MRQTRPTTRSSRRSCVRSAGSGCSSRGSSPPSPNWPEREGIASSYMTRVLRLTLLAPDIVAAILQGRQGPEVTLATLLEPFPSEWAKQAESFR